MTLFAELCPSYVSLPDLRLGQCIYSKYRSCLLLKYILWAHLCVGVCVWKLPKNQYYVIENLVERNMAYKY